MNIYSKKKKYTEERWGEKLLYTVKYYLKKDQGLKKRGNERKDKQERKTQKMFYGTILSHIAEYKINL